MENFLKMSCKLMFTFDVNFQNIDVINYCLVEKVNKLHCWYWHHAFIYIRYKVVKFGLKQRKLSKIAQFSLACLRG